MHPHKMETYHVQVYWHERPVDSGHRTAGSYWSLRSSILHEVVILGFYRADGRFRVHTASCPTIPVGLAPKELSSLLYVVRDHLKATLNCKVIMGSEDTDWCPPPAQGRPQTVKTQELWPQESYPLFYLQGCTHCHGALHKNVLEKEYTCLNCGRFGSPPVRKEGSYVLS